MKDRHGIDDLLFLLPCWPGCSFPAYPCSLLAWLHVACLSLPSAGLASCSLLIRLHGWPGCPFRAFAWLAWLYMSCLVFCIAGLVALSPCILLSSCPGCLFPDCAFAWPAWLPAPCCSNSLPLKEQFAAEAQNFAAEAKVCR